MFSKKQQHKIIKRRFRNIILHLNAFCISNNSEELHQLRVEVKRLRALGRFMDDYSDKNHFAPLLQPVKRMFAQAAKIRNAHVNHKVTQRIPAKKFKSDQQQLQLKEWKKFASRQSSFLKQLETTEGRLYNHLKPVKLKRAYKWYNIQLKKAEDSLLGGTRHYHNARKIIKRMLYINELNIAGPLLDVSYLKRTEDSIGKWHDLMETITLLRRKYPDYKDAIKMLTKRKETLARDIKEISTTFADRSTKK